MDKSRDFSAKGKGTTWSRQQILSFLYQIVAHITKNRMEFESNEYLIWFQRYLQLKVQLVWDM